jgi:hypothetical protein
MGRPGVSEEAEILCTSERRKPAGVLGDPLVAHEVDGIAALYQDFR